MRQRLPVKKGGELRHKEICGKLEEFGETFQEAVRSVK